MAKIKSYESLCWYCAYCTNKNFCKISVGVIPKYAKTQNGFVKECSKFLQDVPFPMSDCEFKAKYGITRNGFLHNMNNNLSIDNLRRFKEFAIYLMTVFQNYDNMTSDEQRDLSKKLKTFDKSYFSIKTALNKKRLYYKSFLPMKYCSIMFVDVENFANRVFKECKKRCKIPREQTK